MAERRMFAKTITNSDAFIDMPMSAQALYFHLSMNADDEGFINSPKKIQRMIGASEDDYKLLILKRFIITFDTGVVVIKHWRINNYLQKDRIHETIFQEEKSMLGIKPNKAYTLNFDDPTTRNVSEVKRPTLRNNQKGLTLKSECIQNVSDLDTTCIQKQADLYTSCTQDVYKSDTDCIHDKNCQNSKNRTNTEVDGMYTECIQNGYNLYTESSIDKINNINISKDILSDSEKNLSDESAEIPKQFQEIIDLWNTLSDVGITPLRIIGPNTERGRMLRARLREYGKDSFKEIVQRIRDSDFLQGKHDGKPWQVTFDWVVHPSNYPKVLEGNYKNMMPSQGSRQQGSSFNTGMKSGPINFIQLEQQLLDN